LRSGLVDALSELLRTGQMNDKAASKTMSIGLRFGMARKKTRMFICWKAT